MAKLTLIVLMTIVATTLAQRFRPAPSVTILPSGANSGRYTPTSGRYRPDSSGRYSGNDGRYVADNSGRYSGNDGRYVPDDSGRYNPDGSGSYNGDRGQYRPDGSGAYTGSSERYSGGAGGAGGAGGSAGSSGFGVRFVTGPSSGLGSGLGSGAGVRRPLAPTVSSSGSRLGSGSGISAAGGFGAPVALQQGSASGLYDNRHYRIIRLDNDLNQDGYHYLYETENGITGEEQGHLENRGTEDEVMRAHGFFTYTGPDNVIYSVRYSADENGFVPQGDHLPTPPPIPDAIVRALEYQRQQGTL